MLPQTQFLNLQNTESNKLYFDELRNPELLFEAEIQKKLRQTPISTKLQ